jgi:hypothetical protein
MNNLHQTIGYTLDNRTSSIKPYFKQISQHFQDLFPNTDLQYFLCLIEEIDFLFSRVPEFSNNQYN